MDKKKDAPFSAVRSVSPRLELNESTRTFYNVEGAGVLIAQLKNYGQSNLLRKELNTLRIESTEKKIDPAESGLTDTFMNNGVVICAIDAKDGDRLPESYNIVDVKKNDKRYDDLSKLAASLSKRSLGGAVIV
jgi:hypothetical protein